MSNIYIALLRGINVSGKHKIKMTTLNALFESLGYTPCKTYIQSGNIVFHAKTGTPKAMGETITAAIFKQFKYTVEVYVLSEQALRDLHQSNPLLQQSTDLSKLHFTFTSKTISEDSTPVLKNLCSSGEQFICSGLGLYLYAPNGYGKTKLNTTAIEKKAQVSATTRNWKTISALIAICDTFPK